MAALTTSLEVDEKQDNLLDLPIVASDIIYRGAICKNNAAGFLAPASAEAGASFAGMAEEEVDNSSGAAGDLNAKVRTRGVFLLTGVSFTQADIGEAVYASDDQTVSITQGANEQEVGKIVELESSTQVWVRLNPHLGL